ncbi:MAG: MBL fold metallo-hydrolase [Alphaproteobacteria bacterium]|nr:MBL fold metallo-hydrolase [Alphaproteobacteria bacterium]
MANTLIAFDRQLDFVYGQPHEVSPLVRRVVARNPSAFTLHGTGTYIVGRGEVAVIDPGPDLPAHVAALQACLAGEQVTHIVITHTHRDHSPAAKPLKSATGAPTYGFGPHGSGRPEGGGEEVEEGGDLEFRPDVRLADSETIAGKGWTLRAVYTPGHTSNHLCFQLAEEKALFSGDHVMGWSTTIVSPPDGDMRRYMASLDKLLARDDLSYIPTHGPVIRQPQGFVRHLIRHRQEREAQILDCLKQGIGLIPDMVKAIYREVPVTLHAAAGRSVLSHLIAMVEDGRARSDGPVSARARFRPA